MAPDALSFAHDRSAPIPSCLTRVCWLHRAGRKNGRAPWPKLLKALAARLAESPRYSAGSVPRRIRSETNAGAAAIAWSPIISKALSARRCLTGAGTNRIWTRPCFRARLTNRSVSGESDASSIGTSRTAALPPIFRRAVIVWTFVTALGLSNASSHWLSVRPCAVGSRPDDNTNNRNQRPTRSAPANQTTL